MTRSELGKTFAEACSQWFKNGVSAFVYFPKPVGALLKAHMVEPSYGGCSYDSCRPSEELRRAMFNVLDAAWKWEQRFGVPEREKLVNEVRALRALVEAGLAKAEKAGAGS